MLDFAAYALGVEAYELSQLAHAAVFDKVVGQAEAAYLGTISVVAHPFHDG